MMRLILSWKFWKDTRGQDLIEYALLAGAIALAAVAAMNSLSGAIQNAFSAVSSVLTTNASSGS